MFDRTRITEESSNRCKVCLDFGIRYGCRITSGDFTNNIAAFICDFQNSAYHMEEFSLQVPNFSQSG